MLWALSGLRLPHLCCLFANCLPLIGSANLSEDHTSTSFPEDLLIPSSNSPSPVHWEPTQAPNAHELLLLFQYERKEIMFLSPWLTNLENEKNNFICLSEWYPYLSKIVNSIEILHAIPVLNKHFSVDFNFCPNPGSQMIIMSLPS